MKYLLLICVDPTITPEQKPGDIDRWVDDVAASRLDGGPLEAPRTAATIRVRGGERVVTEGPFASTPEYVAGFDIVECASREAAIEIAAAHPVARFGAIEVRQLHED